MIKLVVINNLITEMADQTVNKAMGKWLQLLVGAVR
jgi:hypothetical protein